MIQTRPFPRGMLAATHVPHRLLTFGVPMGPLTLLETTGRRSGARRTTPVAVLTAMDERWIVSPFGEVDWVRNARASGTARIGRGRHLKEVRLEDAPMDLVPELLRSYRRRFGVVPFVRAAFEDGSLRDDADPAELARRHPVMRILGRQRSPRASAMGR